jgi:hypothetical protein
MNRQRAVSSELLVLANPIKGNSIRSQDSGADLTLPPPILDLGTHSTPCQRILGMTQKASRNSAIQLISLPHALLNC